MPSSATLWLLDGRLVHEDDAAFFVRQLNASEGHRYAGFRRRERRRQFLLGRMLLRFAVSSLMSLPPDAIRVVERTGNSPRLVLPDSQNLQPCFSLSHSRDWVVCAVSSEVTLGVDIEVNDPTRDIVNISELAFHPNEHFWLLAQSDDARLSAFYRLWSTREALYKLCSSLGRETIFRPLVGVDGTFMSQTNGWHHYTLPHSECTLAICSDRPLPALRKVELSGLTRADSLAVVREYLVGHCNVLVASLRYVTCM